VAQHKRAHGQKSQGMNQAQVLASQERKLVTRHSSCCACCPAEQCSNFGNPTSSKQGPGCRQACEPMLSENKLKEEKTSG
jgi:hypothetical protein